MAGYSGTPLAKKLGIKEGHVVGVVNGPDGLADLLEPLPPGVQLVNGVRGRRDVVVVFARRRREIESKLAALTKAIFPDGAIWIAWPKKSAAKQLGIETDITEDTVREVALPTGLVDNKVCAIDEIWSGLRLVVRLQNRR
jgi:nucleoside-diphosphate-sugar epimerase